VGREYAYRKKGQIRMAVNIITNTGARKPSDEKKGGKKPALRKACEYAGSV
jgi:hypothetical protein